MRVVSTCTHVEARPPTVSCHRGAAATGQTETDSAHSLGAASRSAHAGLFAEHSSRLRHNGRVAGNESTGLTSSYVSISDMSEHALSVRSFFVGRVSAASGLAMTAAAAVVTKVRLWRLVQWGGARVHKHSLCPRLCVLRTAPAVATGTVTAWQPVGRARSPPLGLSSSQAVKIRVVT